MDIQFDWVKPSRGHKGGRTPGPAAQGVHIYHNTAKAENGEPAEYTVVKIGVDVMAKYRLVVGDRIIIGTAEKDGKEYIAIQRVPGDADGFKLSNPGGKKKSGSNRDYGAAKMKRRHWQAGWVPLSALVTSGTGFFFNMDDMHVGP
jgi:hypothetical protein